MKDKFQRMVLVVIFTILLFTISIFFYKTKPSWASPEEDGLNQLAWVYDVKGSISAISLSGDGTSIIAGLSTNEIYSIDKNGFFNWKYTFTSGGTEVKTVSISYDGNTQAAGGGNDDIQVFNEAGGILWASDSDRETVSVSDDGQLIASSDWAGGGLGGWGLRLYNRPGALLWASGGYNPISQVSISGDGSLIVTGEYYGADGYLDATNKQGSKVWSQKEYSATLSSISVSYNGNTIAVGCNDDRVYVYDSIGSLLWSYSTADGNEVYVDVSKDGSTIVIGSNDQKIVTFDRNGTKLWEYMTQQLVHSVSSSYDGSVIAGGVTDGKVYVFSRNGTLLWTYQTENDVKVDLSDSGEELVAGSFDERVYFFLTKQTINRPVAILEVENINPQVNEDVNFDASDSYDPDGLINMYFFDFGDGTNSGWIDVPTTSHTYSQNETYSVILTVIDNMGVQSTIGDLNTAIITVVSTIIEPSPSPSTRPSPDGGVSSTPSPASSPTPTQAPTPYSSPSSQPTPLSTLPPEDRTLFLYIIAVIVGFAAIGAVTFVLKKRR